MKARSWGRVAAMMAAGTIGATALHAQATDPMAPLPAKPTPVAKPAASAKPASTTAAPTAPTKVVPADTLAPGAPAPAAVATPPPPPPPPLVWQPQDVAALMAYVRGVGAEGLDPADYDPDGLLALVQAGEPLAVSAGATDRFNHLSWDLAMGHVRRDAREDWHVVDNDLDLVRQRALLEVSLAYHRVPDALQGLLPTHPQYGALRHALEIAPPGDPAIRRIRLNMDRWRWLPRDLGSKYIIVNVPAYHATLVQDGVTRWKQRAIAGKISTPTPQLSALATGVILNPWWEVPTSISGEVARKPGFVAVKAPDGSVTRWRQPPGPTNALGQLKFVMANPWAIYLHDTNARSRFNSDVRALSHGCIRTEHVVDLATQLLGDDSGPWDAAKVATTLDAKKSVQANFVKPVPVYIIYFTTAALTDGSIVDYDDVYKRDKRVIVALLDKDGKLPPELALPVKPVGAASGKPGATGAAGKTAKDATAKPVPPKAKPSKPATAKPAPKPVKTATPTIG